MTQSEVKIDAKLTVVGEDMLEHVAGGSDGGGGMDPNGYTACIDPNG